MPKNDQISQIINLIFTIRKLMHCKTPDRKGKKYSFLQLMTLRFISREKPLMKDIAGFLSITPPSATSFVDNLIEAGMISRQESATDRRNVRIVLTEKGERFLESGANKVTERMRRSLEELDESEQKDLARILRKIVDNI